MNGTMNANSTGYAYNGGTVGNGYDVIIKRESDRVALVNIIHVSSKTEYLGELYVEHDTDLQAMAVRVGNMPGTYMAYCGCSESEEDDGWDDYADRWNCL
jgi:hypothetical protein